MCAWTCDVQFSGVVKHLIVGTDSAIAENLCAPPCKLPRENETDTGSTLPYSDDLGTCKHQLGTSYLLYD